MNSIANPLDERQQKFVEQTTPMFKPVMVKAFLGKCSPRAAIKANCLSCAGEVRDIIRNCTVTICPLHTFRPYQGKDGEGIEAQGASESEADDAPDLEEVAAPTVIRRERRVRPVKE